MSTSERYDGPAVLLRACVSMLGAGRPDWGRAMLAELAHIESHGRRWAFALGGIRCLACTLPPSGPERVVSLNARVAAIASVSVVAAAFIRFPRMITGAGTWVALAIFAALLAGYVIAAVNLGARVADSRLIRISALAGALIATSCLAVWLSTALGGPDVLSDALLLLGPLVALTLGWLATAKSGSTRVGLGSIGLTALVAGFALFLAWAGWTVIAAGRPYDAGLLRDFKASGFDDLATYAVNDSLGTGMVLLVLVPLLSVFSGLVGAAACVASGQAGRRSC